MAPENQTLDFIILKYIKFSLKYIYIWAALAFMFIILAVLLTPNKNSFPNRYKSEMSMEIALFDIRDVSPLIGALNQLMLEGNSIELSKKLNISIKDASHLKSISVENSIKNITGQLPVNVTDLTQGSYFVFTLTTDTPEVFDLMSKKLYDFFKNDKLYRKTVADRVIHWNNLLKILDKGISNLEQLNASGTVSAVSISKSNGYQPHILLTNELLITYKKEKSDIEDYHLKREYPTLIQPFVKSIFNIGEKPGNKRLVLNLTGAAIFSFILFALVTAFLFIRQHKFISI